MQNDILLIGGGGHAKVVLDCLQQLGVKVIAVIDNKYHGNLLGVNRLKVIPDGLSPQTSALIAIGDNKVRKQMRESVEFSFINAIHPSSVVSKHALIGKGCVILHRAIVQADAKVGDHVIINTGAQVDHDCTIGDYVHLAPGCILCGTITIGEGTLVGAGAVIKPGVKIGAWVTIGSGAVVVKDLPDFAVAVGNPARIIKSIQP
jgi:sugar O-acyltransferase (sialic acid O-acetyltransferase NeuD family)